MPQNTKELLQKPIRKQFSSNIHEYRSTARRKGQLQGSNGELLRELKNSTGLLQ